MELQIPKRSSMTSSEKQIPKRNSVISDLQVLKRNSVLSDQQNAIKTFLKTVSTIKRIRETKGSTDLITQAKLALITPPKLRTYQDIDKIQNLMSDFQYFVGLKEKYGMNLFLNFCENLYLKKFYQDKEVIRIATEGLTFYIILSGKVGIHIYQPSGKKKNPNSSPIPHLQASEAEQDLVEVNILGSGDSFGELALVESGAKTTATVITKEPCEFACIDRQQFWDIIGKIQQDELYAKLGFLRTLPFLSGWFEQDLKTMSYHFRLTKVKRKQVIFKRGDLAKGIYFVQEGCIELWAVMKQRPKIKFDECQELMIERSINEKSILLCNLPRGGLFGEEELLQQEYRQFTAICGSLTSEVYLISKAEIDQRLWYGDSITTLINMANKCKQSRLDRQKELETCTYLQDRTKEEDLERIEHLIAERGKFIIQPKPKVPIESDVPIPQGQKIDQFVIMKPTQVDFFEAQADLNNPLFEGQGSTSSIKKIKHTPQNSMINKQWVNLDIFQRAKLLGLNQHLRNHNERKRQEIEKQEIFQATLAQRRKKYFINDLQSEMYVNKIPTLRIKKSQPEQNLQSNRTEPNPFLHRIHSRKDLSGVWTQSVMNFSPHKLNFKLKSHAVKPSLPTLSTSPTSFLNRPQLSQTQHFPFQTSRPTSIEKKHLLEDFQTSRPNFH